MAAGHGAVPCLGGPALDLLPARSSPDDLAVSGLVAGLPEGAAGYVRWADLRSLPTVRLRITGEFGPGARELTVVYLDDLVAFATAERD